MVKSVKVKINQLINFTKESDVAKAEKVRLLMEEVINDPIFRSKVSEAQFEDRRFLKEDGSELIINDNKKVLDLLIKGEEQFRDENADMEWDLRVTLYRRLFTTEVGHRKGDMILTKKKDLESIV